MPFKYLLVFILFLAPVLDASLLAASRHQELLMTGTFEKPTLPAQGRKETVLNISRFGRYAIQVKSPQGSALQVVDRLTGPGPKQGVVGETDGRIDDFFEQGAYKIVVYSHEAGSGELKLLARPFIEKNQPKPPRLIRYKVIETQLSDFQQRSYWLDIKVRRTVAIEAAGRSLNDLRLWKNGDWLVDVTNDKQVLEPVEGRPLNAFRIVADLNPGLYLLTAYGGPSQAWGVESDAQPLFLRLGIPKLAEAGRHQFKASLFGVDRYLVPSQTNYFQLALPKSEKASLRVARYRKSNPFTENGSRQSITPKSRIPLAELTTYSGYKGYQLVTVTRDAGAPYTLQFFKSTRVYRFQGSGKYWISTLHSGYGEDVVDATALLFERKPQQKETLVDKDVIRIDPHSGWRRRFNLLNTLTLFLEINESGKYVVEGEGVGAQFRVKPFFVNPPRNYQNPDMKSSGGVWDLVPGIYVLTVDPLNRKRGIIDLRIQAKPLLFKSKPIEPRVAKIADRFAEVNLDGRYAYTLFLNEQPEVKTGVVLRALPIDLTTALPVTQMPQETLRIEVKVPEKGKLAAVTEHGDPLQIWQKGHPIQNESLIPKIYTIEIRNPSNKPLLYNLAFVPQRLIPQMPLPELSPRTLAKLPKFPVLNNDQTVYLEVDRHEKRTFQVKVAQPALYRLETTGLLETEGNLRTRIQPSLDRQVKNGVGRNFLIQQYLREGTYQLTTQPQGDTKGDLGLKLSRTHLNEGGRLISDTPARFTLAPGNGLIYHFHIENPAKYRLRCLGLNQNFRIRLEDDAGWPIIKPGQIAAISMPFDPGDYQVIVLPQAVRARVVTLLERIPPPIEFKGHGPHLLPPRLIGQEIRHRWMEPEGSKTRTPDEWDFSVPAPLEATIHIGPEMEGRLMLNDHPMEADDQKVILGGRLWTQTLAPGKYALLIQSRKPNNRLEYGIMIQFRQLVNGFSRHLRLPQSVPLSVAENSIVQLSSLGTTDVRAKLFNDKNQLIASADDQTDDWNFKLTQRLKPGFYQLRVEPVGSLQAETRLSMSSPVSVVHESQKVPVMFSFDDNRLHRYPLSIAENNDLLLVTAGCRDEVMIGLERKRGEVWEPLGRSVGKKAYLGLLLGKNTVHDDYQLVVQSVDQRGEPVTIQVRALELDWHDEQEMAEEGVPFSRLDGYVPVGVAAVRLKRPGVFHVNETQQPLMCSHAGNQPFIPPEKGLIVCDSRTLCFLTTLNNEESLLNAQRLRLTGEHPLQLTIPAGLKATLDIDPGDADRYLMLAVSRNSQPAILLNDEHYGKPDMNSMGARSHSAVCVNGTSSSTAVTLWNAKNRNQPLALTVRKIDVAPDKFYPLQLGINDMVLKPLSAVGCPLSTGYKKIRLSLPAHTAAILKRNEALLALHWSGDDPLSQQIDSDANQILLLHVDQTEKAANIHLTPITANQSLATLHSRRIIKQYFNSRGSLRLKIEVEHEALPDNLFLNLYGQGAYAMVCDHSGRIYEGKHIPIKGEAWAEINYHPGLLVAWLEDTALDSPYPWQPVDALTTESALNVKYPGKFILQGKRKSFQFENKHAVMVHMKTDTPVITRFSTASGRKKMAFFPEGGGQSIRLPVGKAQLLVMPTTPGELSGSIEFLFSAILPLKEGLGPKLMLAPGEERLFSFNLTHDGPIGVGVRGTSDVATCFLMDNKDNILGKGVISMVDLSPGVYFLKVALPHNVPPVEIQPAVVGLDLPDSGPPPKILKKYLQMDTHRPNTDSGRDI